MQNILFIQGGGEGGYEADEPMVHSLEKALGRGYKIIYPQIQSDMNKPDYGWLEQIGREVSRCDDEFILVGHSFGASMILKWLSEHQVDRDLKAVLLLAAPFWSGEEDWKQGLILNDDFTDHLPDEIPIYFYHNKDDEEIPYVQMEEYRSGFPEGHFRLMNKGGHQFNNDLTFMVKDML